MYTHNHWFSKPIISALCLLSLGAQSDEDNVTFSGTPLYVAQRGIQAQQHALVVGINHYKHADDLYLTNLEGTVNDAIVLRDALRSAHVQLPDRRVLLNAQATRAAVVRAWRDMVKQAKPGDTLILTFSGHGGQERDTAPFDEKDRKDENLLFHDFNPYRPTQGRITDDELYGLFKQASAYKILFIADACHSSGMVRSTARPSGRFRSGGFWNIKPDAPPSFPTLPTQRDDKLLPHVTLITAVESDSLKVPETKINNQQHGALSWFFAKALTGKADGNQNGRLERNELAHFLTEKVSVHMKHLQKPKLLPRADTVSVLTLGQVSSSPSPTARPTISKIAIAVQNGYAPQGLTRARVVTTSQTFDLRFVVKNRRTDVFNNTGDKVTTLSSLNMSRWQRVIDKERLLKVLATQFDMRLKPIGFTLREGDKLHKRGEVLHFSIEPGDKWERLNALTLFNLAGNGELQFLYPLTKYKDPLVERYFPYILPPAIVAKPYGGDNLVAVLCQKPAIGLHRLLANKQPNIPKPEQILSHLRGNTCQVGQYAFFSSE
ncbi:MAG: hypothetical protein DRR19_27630 [Candidatus Parabeggiatoa sp. nov. 1]|nr:MAG: hypothetical protein DRR19_27630 [Gammaproteobacteria bacterium]